MGKSLFTSKLVGPPSSFHLFFCPLRHPVHFPSSNVVMRLARQSETTYRRAKAWPSTLHRQLPTSSFQRGNNLVAASTTAKMSGRLVLLGNIKHAALKAIRH